MTPSHALASRKGGSEALTGGVQAGQGGHCCFIAFETIFGEKSDRNHYFNGCFGAAIGVQCAKPSGSQ